MTEGTSPERRANPQERPKKRDINGWVVLDKGVGMTSTHAVAAVKRALFAKKAGHAGTLDPLASGILPIALGEATKTVPFVMDGRKSYTFTVSWGAQTDTDDTEGRIVESTDLIPTGEAIEALLPSFMGAVEQIPPRFSAIKIQGERAYDLARDGEVVEMKPRTVQIDRLEIVEHAGKSTVFSADCGKGTYVRALARDLGVALGCLGHISALRRTRVGPFAVDDAVAVDDLAGDSKALHPVETALADLPSVIISRDMAARLKRGQSILLRGSEIPLSGKIYATCSGVLVAVGDIEAGELVPHRVFHL